MEYISEAAIGCIGQKSEPLATREFAVTFEELAEPAKLAGRWRELESRSEPSFFQSWVWIGNWLATLPDRIRPWLITVLHRGQIAGLGILVQRRVWRRTMIPSNGLFLNATGDPVLDSLTVEFNGFLAERRVKDEVWHACLEFLVQEVPDWDALYMSGVEVGAFCEIAASERGLVVRIERRQPSPYADLRLVRKAGGKLLPTLSRNTRQQVRRAMRGYEKHGALRLRAAETVQEAQTFLSELKILHQAYWTGRGESGAFADEYFEIFHRRLISQHFDDGSVELLRATAGATTVGYLYNFRRGQWFYNYQSGFNYDSDNKLKPGLVSHCLAMQRYLDLGADAYDFLAGYGRYKRSLSNAQHQLAWVVIHKDHLKYRFEFSLRYLYRKAMGKG